MSRSPWPTPNRKLLVPALGKDASFDVSFLKHPCNKDSHSRSFREAAEILVDHCAASEHEFDEMIFPIFFLFRHYLELRLKEIVRYGVWLNILDETGGLRQTLKSHELYPLWNNAKKVIVEMFPNWLQETLKAAESHIAQIHQIDPGGEVFRYHESNGGFNRLSEKVGLEHFRETIAALSNFLEGCRNGVGEAWQNVCDVMRESRD